MCFGNFLHFSLSSGGYLKIIPQGRVTCQLIDSLLDKNCLVGNNHLMSNKREWNNCSIKNNQGILLDLVDFISKMTTSWHVMVADIPWPLIKPIKTLELHYPMQYKCDSTKFIQRTA